jgi:hypothetical protein
MLNWMHPGLRYALRLQGFYAAGCGLSRKGIGAALLTENFDAGGTEFFAGVSVGEVKFEAVAVGNVNEEADGVGPGVVGDQGDEGVEARAVVVFVFRFVEEESEDA